MGASLMRVGACCGSLRVVPARKPPTRTSLRSSDLPQTSLGEVKRNGSRVPFDGGRSRSGRGRSKSGGGRSKFDGGRPTSDF